MKLSDSPRKALYSPLLDGFFNHPLVDGLVIVAISCSVLVAVGSLCLDSALFEVANHAFTLVFCIELSLRFFTYRSAGLGLVRRKGEYVRDWWLDWVATIPWDLLLALVVPVGSVAVFRLLRLPRIFRLLRFRRVRQSESYRVLGYRFKRLLEGSIFRQMFVLLVGSLVVVALFTVLLNVLGVEVEHGDNFWFSLITMISSDSLFELEGQAPLAKLVVLVLTFVGVVVFNGILLAILVGKLMDQLDEFKKGHGDVVEKDHIVLLGWSEAIPHIVDELETHCRVERKRLLKVLVLRDPDHEEAEQLLVRRPHVEVIQRFGSCYNVETLRRMSVSRAAAVVVFGDATGKHRSARLNDSLVTKALVSIQAVLQSDGLPGHQPVVVLNFADYSRVHYVKSHLSKFGVGGVHSVFFDPVFFTAKLVAAMCANPNLHDIYNELLTAEGSEFHFVPAACPPGTRFARTLLANPRAIPLGYRRQTADADHRIRMVPDPDEEIPADAELIVLAADSAEASAFRPEFRGGDGENEDFPLDAPEQGKGDLVIIGINTKIPGIVEEFAKQDRRVWVVDNQSEQSFRDWYWEVARSSLPERTEFRECHFRDEAEIETAIDFDSVGQIIILADGHLLGDASPDQIDADTFSRLLMVNHLIDAEEHRRARDIYLVVEILTPDSEEVVREIRNCSHVVGPLVIGRLITTFALYPELEGVFRDMIQLGKEDILCRSPETISRQFPALPPHPSFADFLALPCRGAIPLGWVEPASGCIRLNPPREAKLPEGAEVIYLCRAG